MTSVEVTANQTTLRSFPVYTNCCGGSATTVTNKMNTVSLVTLICLTGCWMCHQAYKRKDINCYDADHVCSKCGKSQGNYSACN